MIGNNEFIAFAAGVLEVPAAALSLESEYASIPQWDSIAHLRLVTAIASRYGTEIPFADITVATSLWELWRRVNCASPKKVVAVDLDGTLWDGVVGEDGVDAIRPRTDFQRQLKELKRRGVLLVALSKNNPEDIGFLFPVANAVSPRAPEGMVLAETDFAAWRIDWNDKAANLSSVAAELNLGAEAFVFVDDNPAERLTMGRALPDVTVARFPPNLAAYFPDGTVTEEDRVKTEQYRAEAQRRQFLGSTTTDGESLFELLGIRLDIHPMRADEAPRVAQLSQKTNQFNVCTNRYAVEDIRRFAEDGAYRLMTVHAGDRFGEQGLVAFVLVRVWGAEAEIVDWVMSCRTMNRTLEYAVESEVEKILASDGVAALRATYRPTPKNAPVANLFGRFGFAEVSRTAEAVAYACQLPRPPLPHQFSLTS